MAVADRPSEFGGKVQRNGIFPPITPAGTPGHIELTAAEKLRLDYQTGQHDDSTATSDNGEAWTGVLAYEEAREAMPKPEKYRDSMQG